MTTSSTLGAHGLDGAAIDGDWYTSVTDFARHTHWLNGTAFAYTSYGVALFAVFLLAGWWLARRHDARTMAAALFAPVSVVLSYLVNDGIKSVFEEPRPCRALPHDFLIEPCPPTSDFAFPSNHTTVAFAVAAALFFVNRRLAAVTALAAVLMGASRVYVGAHYPHDVMVAAVAGSCTAVITVLLARRFGAPLVTKLRDGALGPLLSVPARPNRHRAA
ncbi:phosphatase PAP2 family protein [Streptomyces sp. ISL-11]|uniref:phosphatase PAP2 family protein n=1 Tax=Streptomyces sp. ISL-11 TaxID=2819174 RepID=UPI001BE66BED|nr:phosphatase PAP2 family protein [Streptomyces sp. ISL-11]MBT2383582.1 phosphatase PAP2 family protein [Streptomyces sp. ISL-11]